MSGDVLTTETGSRAGKSLFTRRSQTGPATPARFTEPAEKTTGTAQHFSLFRYTSLSLPKSTRKRTMATSIAWYGVTPVQSLTGRSPELTPCLLRLWIETGEGGISVLDPLRPSGAETTG